MWLSKPQWPIRITGGGFLIIWMNNTFACYIEEFLLVFESESRFSCKIRTSLTVTQSGEFRGCRLWSNPCVSYGRNTHSVFLSNSLNPLLFSCLKRHVFLPFLHTSALWNLHFLGFKYAANGALCQSPLRFFLLHIPYLASPDVRAAREAGKSQSVCAAFGTGRVSSNELFPQR